MYKRMLNKIQAYSPIIVVSVWIVTFSLKRQLTEFIDRDDLTEYIRNHRSWVNVFIYLNFAILAISVACTIMYIILMSWLRKENSEANSDAENKDITDR
jgi:uncharacterized membrane protein